MALVNCPNCGGLWEPHIGCMDCGTEAPLGLIGDDE